MTNTAKALYGFFGSFDLSAYEVNSVPDDAQLPYITYQLREPNWRDSGQLYAEIWYRSTSMRDIDAKTDEIKAAIGEGCSIPTDGGAIYLSKFTSEHLPMAGDNTLKRMYLTMIINALTT